MMLIADIGSTVANSYQTLSEADNYFSERLHTEVWDTALKEIKEAALIWATRIIDVHFQWYGTRQTELQALQWPRMNAFDQDGWIIRISTIPKQLKYAQAELAILLIEENRASEVETKGIKEMWIDRFTRFVFDKEDIKHVIPEHILTMIQFLGDYIGNEAKGNNGTLQLVRG